MERKVELNKQVFNKRQYEQVIDTSFTQLAITSEDNVVDETPTVEEFFQDYDTLFFDIPKTGENSHETLIVQSTEYIDYSPINEEITALTEEITSLREELLEARQQLADLANVTN
jgi:hypothetical protein